MRFNKKLMMITGAALLCAAAGAALAQTPTPPSPPPPPDPADVEQVFKMIDTNKDGVLQLDEVKAWAKRAVLPASAGGPAGLALATPVAINWMEILGIAWGGPTMVTGGLATLGMTGGGMAVMPPSQGGMPLAGGPPPGGSPPPGGTPPPPPPPPPGAQTLALNTGGPFTLSSPVAIPMLNTSPGAQTTQTVALNPMTNVPCNGKEGILRFRSVCNQDGFDQQTIAFTAGRVAACFGIEALLTKTQFAVIGIRVQGGADVFHGSPESPALTALMISDTAPSATGKYTFYLDRAASSPDACVKIRFVDYPK